jgi:hypothetical protein
MTTETPAPSLPDARAALVQRPARLDINAPDVRSERSSFEGARPSPADPGAGRNDEQPVSGATGRTRKITDWAAAAAVGIAVVSLVGWLEEVARTQAFEKYYGLPLTASADPRGAAAFAMLPLAVALAADLLLLAAVIAVLVRRWRWGVLAASVAGTLMGLPPRTWDKAAVELAVSAATAGCACVLVALVGRPLVSTIRAAISRAASRQDQDATRRRLPHPDESKWLLRGAYAATAIAAAVWVPLWGGDRAGRLEARDTANYYVVTDRCDPTAAVIWFGDSDTARRVRVARRVGAIWNLAPGILTVPLTEPIALAHLGRVSQSTLAPFPPPVSRLPRVC